MHLLPNEILLHIVSFLDPPEIANLQLVSRRFLRFSRDNSLWKQLCFEHSVAERRRRRLEIARDVDPRLAELVRAADNIAGTLNTAVHDASTPSAGMQMQTSEAKKQSTLLANWDPTYPQEKVNWYQDFIHRHAPHSTSWFQTANYGHRDDNLHREATGCGILYDDTGMADKLVAPLEDGSVSIWDARGDQGRRGRILAKSAIGMLPDKGSDLDIDSRLTQSNVAMTETGAVECVSIDSRQKKGFFAVQNVLNEVDLHTLQVVSRTPYPFAITALSEARHPTPLTVGTNWTIHLHDTRKPPPPLPSTTCELIGGTPTLNSLSQIQTGDFGGHVSLAQPGALSILHLPTTRDWDGNGDIWVGGRFTSFLNFDRRYFPRLHGTLHSGARLSCITALPYPFIPSDLRSNPFSSSPSRLRDAKVTSGHTLIAAGEYKGKGSLELYSLSSDPSRGINSSDYRTAQTPHTSYQNRQTASGSKLLSVAPHGTRLVFSDGDGNLKWVERDASTSVRQFNINGPEVEARPSSTVRGMDFGWGDIVQKIIPTVSPSSSTSDIPLGEDNLVIWTGDGRLGMVGFGHQVFSSEALDGAVEEIREEEERRKEFGAEMRRALEMQARELRWLRGYGL